MNYWRMQLHPADSDKAVQCTIQSLAAGYIGLGFGSSDVGDLLLISEKYSLPKGQYAYWAFAHDMKKSDQVLIIAHHFPFALAKVDGPYNYIRESIPELPVWFRHFRPVKDVLYYADFVTNARSWEEIKMTNTIARLDNPSSKSYHLIEEWLEATR